MPRAGRLNAPGVVHDIMVRAIEWGNIFRDDFDREDFLAWLAALNGVKSSLMTLCIASGIEGR